MSEVKEIYINSASGFRDIGGTVLIFLFMKMFLNFIILPKRVKLSQHVSLYME